MIHDTSFFAFSVSLLSSQQPWTSRRASGTVASRALLQARPCGFQRSEAFSAEKTGSLLSLGKCWEECWASWASAYLVFWLVGSHFRSSGWENSQNRKKLFFSVRVAWSLPKALPLPRRGDACVHPKGGPWPKRNDWALTEGKWWGKKTVYKCLQ